MSDTAIIVSEADERRPSLSLSDRPKIKGWKRAEEIVQKSRMTLYRMVKAGTFPAPLDHGENSVAWYADEIEAWLANRPRKTYRKSGITSR